VPAGPIVGRAAELAHLASLLGDERARLVTLTGPGGVGKTFLALHAAEALVPDVVEDALWVSLAGIDDPDEVVPTIARSVGLREAGTRDLEDQLASLLARRRTLVVLDNFEHVAPAAPILARLVASLPGVQLLATSRSSLRVTGEHELPVPPLSLDDAAELLVRRARAVAPDVELDANVETVNELCRRLDCLPLAIELAAARTKLLTLDEILERATRPLDLLTVGRRDAPERQRTLRSTIGWSYTLLDEPEALLFRALSVFVDGATLPAAAAVGGSDADDPSLLDSLDSLVDKSLVRRVTAGGSTRLVMLETIRDYAGEALVEVGEHELRVEAHAAYFVALAETVEPTLASPEASAALERIDADYANLLAALARLLERGDPRGLELAAAIWRLWYLRGRLSEGRRWLERALDESEGAPDLVRARALSGAATLALHQADHGAAASLAANALGLAREAQDNACVASALRTLALVARDQGEQATARSLAQESLEAAKTLGDPRSVALALSCLGRVEFFAGQNRRSSSLHSAARELFESHGSPSEADRERLFVAWCRLIDGDLEESRPLFERALESARGLDDRWSAGLALGGLLRIAAAEGDPVRSRACGLEVLGICSVIDERFLGSMSLVGLADSLPASAGTARLLGAADRMRESVGARWPVFIAKEYRRAIEAARGALAPEAFAVAFSEGRGFGLDEATDAYESLSRPDRGPAGPLTSREVDVLSLVARGLSNRQVAEELVVSERTVHAHLRTTYRKLGVASRAGATRWAIEHGIA
jgi:predicted ATPase/DNA-binding CsgD family transcriptional regulator